MLADVNDNGLLAQAAALAGATVAIVKHSGRRGTQQEFTALVAALEQVGVEYPENLYVQALLTPATREQISGFAQQYTDAEAPKQTSVNEFKMAALNRCGQAAEWLRANAPQADAAEVKAAILAVCRRVAAQSQEAQSQENNVTSGAGDNVDPLEQSTLEEIARALEVM